MASVKNRDTKKEKRFTRGMQRRLTASFAFVLLCMILLLIRIAVVNATKGNRYAKQVLSQQTCDSRTIPARRGEIVDRNGIVLAKSDRRYNVILDCYAINQDEDYIEPTIAAVSDQFGIEESKVREVVTAEKTRDSRYQIIAGKITKDQKELFEDYKNGKDLTAKSGMSKDTLEAARKDRADIQGVWFEEVYQRSYPEKTLAANVVGFSNDIGDGITGVENYYNSTLTGTDGRQFGYLDSSSDFARTTIQPDNGKTVQLTLDMNIQQIVQDQIDDFDKEYGTESSDGKGAKNVGVIVMDPNTGGVLAMASNHEYDLSDPYKGYSESDIREMGEEAYVEALNEGWENFCVSESYEPGSVVKPITVASALEQGAVRDGDHYYCGGSLFITDTTINCDNIYGHGDETLEYAIVNSCNVALMQIGAKLGVKNFIHYQKDFGFGSPTGIDLPNENSGVIYNENTMHEVELATCSFGQGFTVNMVQEAAAFSAAVNGGIYYQPHVVGAILNDDGTTSSTVEPLALRQPVSQEVSRLIRRYIHTAVEEGTGKKSRVPGYRTGGKTGTAEKIDPETGRRWKGKYLVSFIGAAPIDDPKVVIYCVVDEPNVEDQADSSYPQTLFRKIATEVYPYMGLYPTEPVTDQLLMELGITKEDTVENEIKSAVFQCFGADGTLYNDAAVNEEGQVVDSEGNVIDGVTVDVDAGTVTDAKGNVIEVDLSELRKDQAAQSVADNPDIASPPDAGDDEADDSTWSGAEASDQAGEDAADVIAGAGAQ